MGMLDETGEMTGESNFWSEEVNATFPTDCNCYCDENRANEQVL